MKKQLSQLQKDFEKGLKNVSGLLHLDELEQEFFGRKSGSFTAIAKEMKTLSADMKKEVGQLMNDVRTNVKDAIETKRIELQREAMGKIAEEEAIDVTQPQLPKKERGNIHPMMQGLQDMIDVALSMGFLVEDGPELESQQYVFDALNFSPDHPAREGMDTFYIKDKPELCMRAHVSNMQVRLMKKYNEGGTKSVRAAYPGRVFRNEALDATHEHTFYQFEALVVDKTISIANLTAVMKEFVSGLYKKDMTVRFRPGHFPFTEPSFELDIKADIGRGEEWLEMAGCGLIHPNVLKEAGYDPEEYQGLAFGMGLNRLVMVKHGIEDIRHFQSGDLRFLKQF